MLRKSVLPVLAVFLLGAMAACGSQESSNETGGSPDVVVTTTQIADWTRKVGGEAVRVHQILEPNTDPHEYEPRPDDVEATAEAVVVFENGDNLDEWIDEVVSESGGDPKVVNLGEGVPVKLRGEPTDEISRYDPHWWHNPRNAEEAVREIRDTLIALDPGNESEYERNADDYLAKLVRLDGDIRRCMDEVPPGERKLVTDHDAFSYFAERYRVDVIGAIIPSQTTQAQPSAMETAKLISLIERENVKAVFPESSINPKLAEQVARETGASSDYTLYGDTLGPKGSSGDTYLKMEAHNAQAMVEGFTGGEQSCAIAGAG
jgi:zinc/manganese transport system substrate-binding protein